MFGRFVLRALAYRKRRLSLAFSALAVAAALATVLFGIYSGVERRLHDEFRAYGANIVAVPASGVTVPLSIADRAAKLGADAAPYLFTPAGGIVLAGFVPEKAKPLTAYWHVEGTRDIGPGECIAGVQLNLRIGETARAGSCVVKGIVSTGGPEDRELLVPFAAAQSIAGLGNAASVIEIRAPGDRVEAVRSALAAAYPIAQFRTVRSIADTEANVVFKIRTALFLLTLLILTITTLCVSSNFSEMVLDRSKEIGILKALGAAERRIAGLLVSESLSLALGASMVGYAAGVFAAAAIGTEIFGGAFHVRANWFVFAAVAAVTVAVAVLATGMAASRIWNIQAAAILRGE